jgi:hypothetical protein
MLEKELHVLEGEIETRTGELKHLMKQANARSRLEHVVPEGYDFKLMDGRKLSSLLDLKSALRSMPDTVFNHHVTATRNDFASWIRGAMNDGPLADKIGPIRDRVQLELYLGRVSDEQRQAIEHR